MDLEKNIVSKRERESVNHSLEVFSFQNLLKAYYQCRKHKRKTLNAAKFELNFEKNLIRLENQLKNYSYRPGKSICFVVTYPKAREVFAADFKDRVIHHLLVNYLEPIWEKKFIFHSYACRKEKGSQLAINHLRKFLRKSTANFTKSSYYLQADISAFFMSLNKKILFNLIEKHTEHSGILWLTRTIIFHDPTENFHHKSSLKLFEIIPKHKSLFYVPKEQGLPIGNLTSQFFANIYLNQLDQFVKHQLKAKYYLRYVDDILIVHQDRNKLEIYLKEISKFLENNLKLKLHPQKTTIRSIYQGINFVGYIVKSKCNFIRNRTVANLKRELWKFNQFPIPEKAETFSANLKDILAVINSYYGQFRHANTFKLRKLIYQNHFKILKTYLVSKDADFTCFQIKRNSAKPDKTIARG